MDYARLIWDEIKEEQKNFLKKLAPVAIFTYNRLDHTKKTIEALKKNIYSEYSAVIIFSDGPKTDKDVNSVNAVRNYLHTITGFKSIEIVERQINWGLAENIMDGVTRIVNQYGKIIVLEDDIVTSRWFLKYMNDALKLYEADEKIMQVSAYMYPIDTAGLPQAYFLEIGGFAWGWGTWENSWKYFERNPKSLKDEFTKEQIYKFNIDGTVNMWKQVLDNISGKIRTWAVFWAISIFRQQGLNLVVRDVLACNKGFDGSGVHCEVDSIYDVKLSKKPITEFPVEIFANTIAFERTKAYLKKVQPGFLKRSICKIRAEFIKLRSK